MKRLLTVMLWSCAVLGTTAVAGESDAPSFVTEGSVKAPVATVWKVWSTPQGYQLLGVAKVDMDFRVGGVIRSHYRSSGSLGDEQTIENRILAYEPQHMLAICIQRPPRSLSVPRSVEANLDRGDADPGERHRDSRAHCEYGIWH